MFEWLNQLGMFFTGLAFIGLLVVALKLVKEDEDDNDNDDPHNPYFDDYKL